LNNIQTKHTIKNVTYFPINQKDFNKSLINCDGIITGGGFETPAEALYLGKKILSIPIRKHYEQECNAAALKKMGVPVLYDVGDDFDLIIDSWLDSVIKYPSMKANNINETLQYLFDTYHD
jgi:uncharacterized protein (TIGR00661 family)